MSQGLGFSICAGKGFHLTFENGWTVSVQFGGGNYCANHDEDVRMRDPDSWNAEVAAWGPDHKLIDFGSDTVRGWQTPAAVLALLNAAANGDLAAGKIPPEERSR